jgi:hypothetical protein
MNATNDTKGEPCADTRCTATPNKNRYKASDGWGTIPITGVFLPATGDLLEEVAGEVHRASRGIQPALPYLEWVRTERGIFLLDGRIGKLVSVSSLSINAAAWVAGLRARGVDLQDVQVPAGGKWVCPRGGCAGRAILAGEELAFEIARAKEST